MAQPPPPNETPATGSTPQNPGTGSHMMHDEHHTQQDYAGYIKADLASSHDISLESFFDVILKRGKDWMTEHDSTTREAIQKNPGFHTLAAAYAKIRRAETQRYEPFVEMVNWVIEQLEYTSTADRASFCRNDNTYLSGSKACRKPDVLAVAEATIGNKYREGVAKCHRSGPKIPFWWHEPLGFFEFKMNKGPLETEFQGSTMETLYLRSEVVAPWRIVLDEIIPMACANGLALTPWQVLAGGKLRSAADEKRREDTGGGGRTTFGDWRKTPEEAKMSEALEKVAAECGKDVDTTAVAIAYVMSKAPYVFPIIGGRKVEHLHNNIKAALEITLSHDQIKHLESAVHSQPAFLTNFIGNGNSHSGMLWSPNAHIAPQPIVSPIGGISQA